MGFVENIGNNVLQNFLARAANSMNSFWWNLFGTTEKKNHCTITANQFHTVLVQGDSTAYRPINDLENDIIQSRSLSSDGRGVLQTCKRKGSKTGKLESISKTKKTPKSHKIGSAMLMEQPFILHIHTAWMPSVLASLLKK